MMVQQRESAGKREVRCICGHHFCTHLFEGVESICCANGCSCKGFIRWEVILMDQCGQLYTVHDIRRFCRLDYAELFDPADLEVKQKPGGTKQNTWTNAEVGLQKLAEDAIPSWKGWTLITKPKTFKP